MFQKLIPPPKQYSNGKQLDITVLPFVWTYLYMDGNVQKAHSTYNGSKQ